MRKYDSYKDSDVEWIGEIPIHWDLKTNKFFTQSQKNKSEKGEEELLSVSEYHGVIPRRNIRENEEHLTRSESLEGYLKVRKGELVSNIMLMWKRGLGVSEFEGIVSPSYSVFSFLNSEPKYFHYLFRTDQYVSEFRRNSTGVIESRLRLYDDSFGSLKSHFPPLSEQTQIVSYLDRKTEEIDKLIQTKVRKIELLKEYRTSLISKVVTKGLNPNVKMKDSGVEWIGEIPSHWEIIRLKYFCEMVTEKGLPKEDDIKISPENVESNTGECFNLYSEYSGEGVRFTKEDILLNKLRLYLKKILFTDYDGYSMGEMIVLRIFSGVKRFYYLSFFHQGLIDELDNQSTGVKLPRVSPEIILNTLFPFPPLSEQTQIVSYLDEQTQLIDKNIQTEERKIELLKEFRQSLISEVVTGKIKVCNDEKVH